MRAADLLPPALAERHAHRREHRRRRRRSRGQSGAIPTTPARRTAAAARAERARAAETAPDALQRARLAGGPIDNACYTCACGMVFAAPVSTTVSCPRCGTYQAW